MRSEYETLIRQSACTVVDRLRAGDITPFDALDALEARIAQVEPRVNALPTLCFDRARAHAATLMTKPPAERGLLAGLPVAIKDLIEVSGVRTTHGSPAFADMICEQSDLLVENLESRGGVVYAKSNTPEFGASGHTDNDVFGPTRNRECAGTSFRYHFDWLSIAYAITLVCSPALSLPCGFTRAGLPVGLQLVAPPRCEARLLGGARTLEEILGVNRMTPIEPRTRASARGTDAIIH